MGDRQRRERHDDPSIGTVRIPRGMRKLVVSGQTWHWRFGNVIDIRDAEGKGHKVSLAELLDDTWDGVERAKHKRYLRANPALVVEHIQRWILGYDDLTGFPKESPHHRHQAEIRKGWVAFPGPRGMWQMKPAPWILVIHSPEDVRHEARCNEVLGMSVDEWVDIKAADLEAIGSSFEELWKANRALPEDRRRHQVDVMMSYDAPSMPKPTARQLEDYVLREIIGKAARQTLAEAA